MNPRKKHRQKIHSFYYFIAKDSHSSLYDVKLIRKIDDKTFLGKCYNRRTKKISEQILKFKNVKIDEGDSGFFQEY